VRPGRSSVIARASVITGSSSTRRMHWRVFMLLP
jgi:hypothetical protein